MVTEKIKETFSELKDWIRSMFNLRYLMLLMICFVQMVTIYIADTPGGLENTIIKVLNIETEQYSLMYSLYSWPSVLVCLFSGLLIDKVFGLSAGWIIFVCIAVTGQMVLVIGALLGHYHLMLFGRFLIGSGNEVVYILNKVTVAVLFKDHSLSFALSLHVTFGRLGGFVALGFNEYLYESFNFVKLPSYKLGLTLSVGFFLLVICLVISMCIAGIHKEEDHNDVHENKEKCCKKAQEYFKNFTLILWLSVFIMGLYRSNLISFTSIGQKFLMQKYGFTIGVASIINATIFGVIIFMAPLLGMLIHLAGYYLFWVLSSGLIGLFIHIFILISPPQASFIPPILGILSSVSYAILGSTIWILPASVIEENKMATAYGIMISFYNFSMSITAILVGFLVDNEGYFVTEVYYCLVQYIVIFLIIFLFWVNITTDAKLNIPRKKKVKS